MGYHLYCFSGAGCIVQQQDVHIGCGSYLSLLQWAAEHDGQIFCGSLGVWTGLGLVDLQQAASGNLAGGVALYCPGSVQSLVSALSCLVVCNCAQRQPAAAGLCLVGMQVCISECHPGGRCPSWAVMLYVADSAVHSMQDLAIVILNPHHCAFQAQAQAQLSHKIVSCQGCCYMARTATNVQSRTGLLH